MGNAQNDFVFSFIWFHFHKEESLFFLVCPSLGQELVLFFIFFGLISQNEQAEASLLVTI